MDKKYKSLQLQIDVEVIEMLKREKKKQRKSMSEIVEELLIENFATPKEKLQRL